MCERRLTEEAQAARDEFEAYYNLFGGCVCGFMPTPCPWCRHPGNPLNQAADSCYMQEPVTDIMNITRKFFS